MGDVNDIELNIMHAKFLTVLEEYNDALRGHPARQGFINGNPAATSEGPSDADGHADPLKDTAFPKAHRVGEAQGDVAIHRDSDGEVDPLDDIFVAPDHEAHHDDEAQ